METLISKANDRLAKGFYMSSDKLEALSDSLTFGQQVMDEINESLYFLPGCVAASESKLERKVYAEILRILRQTQRELNALGIPKG